MRDTPKPHEIYRHFKGNLYQIITIARHSETGELLVVYQAMYGDFRMYARPLTMFMEKTDRIKYPDAAQEYRFELVDVTKNAAGTELETVWEKTMGAAQQTAEEKISGAAQQSAEENALDAAWESAGENAMDAVPEPVRERNQAAISRESRGETGESMEEEAENLNIDPMVLEFLDASTYEERLNILAGLHYRITDDMINVMAVATDIEVEEGDVEERYVQLRNCLLTLERFECNRLR